MLLLQPQFISGGQETTDDKAWAFNAWAADSHDGKIEFGNGSAQRASYAEGVGGFVAGNIVGVALDMDNGALWFSKNGTWMGANLSAGNAATISEIAAGTVTNAAVGPNANCADNINLSSLTVVPVFTVDGVTATTTINFGQNPFTYTVPTGFKRLTTANLPAPTVIKPDDHFASVRYEGTGSELAISSLNFKPDLVWIKNRDADDHHMIYDSVREATKDLHPNEAALETTTAETLKSFDANGFTLGTDVQVNTSSESYIAWCWKAGGAPTTDNDNTSGAMDDGSVFKGGVVQTSYTPSGSPSTYPTKMSIASHGGFSVVEYVGTGSNATVPHGLDRAAGFFVTKPINQNHSWSSFHDSFGSVGADDPVFYWDTAAAPSDQAGAAFQDNPIANANTITLGTQTGVNQNTVPHIMYTWARTPGMIGIGSFEGINDADGAYVVVDDGASGFRPAWLMIKGIDAARYWVIHDSERSVEGGVGGFNPASPRLHTNTEETENVAGAGAMDFTANGFKLRNTSSFSGGAAETFVYIACAEHPFGGDGVAQARAR